MKQFDLKRLLCLTVSSAVVLSFGAMAFADENDEEDAVPVVVEETSDESVVSEDVFVDEDITSDEEEIIIEEDDFEAVTDIACDIDAEEVSASPTIPNTGWYFGEDNFWYYYKDGVRLKGMQNIGGKTYCFDKYSGFMIVGLWTYDGKRYFFGLDGSMKKGWVQVDNEWYYYGSDGAAVNGLVDIGGSTYYFDQNYRMYSDRIAYVDGSFYAMGENGKMLKDGLYEVNGYKYLAGEDGILLSGLQECNGKTYYFTESADDYPYAGCGILDIDGVQYYFDTETYEMRTGWIHPYNNSKEWIYCNSKGEAAQGWEKINKKWYYFDEYNCYLVTGMFIDDTGSLYYSDSSGVMQTGWKKIDNEWYYFDSKGKAVDGLQTINGKGYYFVDHKMQTGLAYIDNDYYYFDTNGVMLKDKMVALDNSDYTDFYGRAINVYFGSDGKQVYDKWQKVNGEWHYFRSFIYMGMDATGLIRIDGAWYYFDDNGVMQTGWQQPYGEKSPWIYLNGKGKAVTGLNVINGKTYYFSEDGNPYMNTGIVKIVEESGGIISSISYYYFDTNGAMKTGWIKSGKYYYYAGTDGVLCTGFNKIGDKWYFFYNYPEYDTPYMLTGFFYNGASLYYSDSNGVCQNYDNPMRVYVV